MFNIAVMIAFSKHIAQTYSSNFELNALKMQIITTIGFVPESLATVRTNIDGMILV